MIDRDAAAPAGSRDDDAGGPSIGGLTRRSFTGAVALAALTPRPVSSAEGGTDPSGLDAARLQSAYRDRSLSPQETVTAIFTRIDALNPAVNAFIVMDKRSHSSRPLLWMGDDALNDRDGREAA